MARHSGEDPLAVILAKAGIQCNNESPRPAPACRKAGATRYSTGYRDKPGMTTKVNVVIPPNARSPSFR